MEKVILVIIFITGLKHSIEQWKLVIIDLRAVIFMRKRGFHPNDFILCNCDKCKNNSESEKEKSQKETYNSHLKNLLDNAVNAFNYAVLLSSLTLLSIYIYFQLTFNF